MFRTFFSALLGFAAVTAAFAAGWIIVIAGPNADEARRIEGALDRLSPKALPVPAEQPEPVEPPQPAEHIVAGDSTSDAEPPRLAAPPQRRLAAAAAPGRPQVSRPSQATRRAARPLAVTPPPAELEFQTLARDLDEMHAPLAPEPTSASASSDLSDDSGHETVMEADPDEPPADLDDEALDSEDDEYLDDEFEGGGI